jgi:hypothetical protein
MTIEITTAEYEKRVSDLILKISDPDSSHDDQMAAYRQLDQMASIGTIIDMYAGEENTVKKIWLASIIYGLSGHTDDRQRFYALRKTIEVEEIKKAASRASVIATTYISGDSPHMNPSDDDLEERIKATHSMNPETARWLLRLAADYSKRPEIRRLAGSKIHEFRLTLRKDKIFHDKVYYCDL